MESFLQSLLVPALVLVFLMTPYIEAIDDRQHSIINFNRRHSHHLGGHHGKFRASQWNFAHATFYGGNDGSDTRGNVRSLINFQYLLVGT